MLPAHIGEHTEHTYTKAKFAQLSSAFFSCLAVLISPQYKYIYNVPGDHALRARSCLEFSLCVYTQSEGCDTSIIGRRVKEKCEQILYRYHSPPEESIPSEKLDKVSHKHVFVPLRICCSFSSSSVALIARVLSRFWLSLPLFLSLFSFPPSFAVYLYTICYTYPIYTYLTRRCCRSSWCCCFRKAVIYL